MTEVPPVEVVAYCSLCGATLGFDVSWGFRCDACRVTWYTTGVVGERDACNTSSAKGDK
jgi:hypothetical protein